MKKRTTNQRTRELDWDRRASWWPCEAEGVMPVRDSYLWMCAQDVGTEVWHHLDSRYRRDETEALRLEACSNELREILVDSLPFDDHHYDLCASIANFAEMVAQQWVLDGEVPFEVRAGWDRSRETARLEEANIFYVYPESIAKFGWWLFQVVPANATEGKAGPRLVRLCRRRIVTFKPPRQYRRALALLRSGFPLIGESEQKWRMSAVEKEVHEDFKTVHRSYTVRRARLSAPIGWDGRSLFHEHIADFHWAWRQLQWHRFCIEVRDAILTSLAGIFRMIGNWRGENPRLVWEHLPTVTQVCDAESRMMSQAVRFDELLKPFRPREHDTSD